MRPNLLHRAATALAASSRVESPAVALHYLAGARYALDEARVQLTELERLVAEREAALVGPAGQRTLPVGGST